MTYIYIYIYIYIYEFQNRPNLVSCGEFEEDLKVMIGVFGDVRRRRSLKGSVDISKGD